MAGPHKSFFETILGRDPEKRAQDALYPYLFDLYPRLKREHFYSQPGCKKRFFDFYIPPDSPDQYPVIIELKHYSVHQSGGMNVLLGGPGSRFSLYTDLIKPRPAKSHLIQVGMLTAVVQFPEVLLNGRTVQRTRARLRLRLQAVCNPALFPASRQGAAGSREKLTFLSGS